MDGFVLPEKGRNVFVQNLPFEATRRDVIEAFKQCGRVENVRDQFLFLFLFSFVSSLFSPGCVGERSGDGSAARNLFRRLSGAKRRRRLYRKDRQICVLSLLLFVLLNAS